MTKTSTVSQHPRLDEINADLSRGVPIREIARKQGLSASAVARHKLARHSAVVAALGDDSMPPDELMGRLRDLADSTRQARKLADATATPAVRARVASAELAVLDRLVDRLGITDMSAIEEAQATGALVRAVQAYVQSHPDAAPDVFSLMGEEEALIELRDALRAQMRNTK